MKVKEALQRLGFTLSKQNKPNATDIEAFNEIVKWISTSNEKIVHDNLLFAKLYLVVLKEFSNVYQSVDFANKEISKELSKPLGFHIEKLKQELNFIELNQYFKSLNLKPTFNEGLNIEEIKSNIEQNKETFKDVDLNLVKETFTTWDNDSIIAHTNYSVNELFNKYKNEP
jgi:hypothetical protein